MKKIFYFVAGLLFAAALFADGTQGTTEMSKASGNQKLKNIDFGLSLDLAYYPKAKNVQTGIVEKDVVQFAPTTGIYNGIEGRFNFYGTYTIPTPLGSHFLVKDASVELTEKIEITPVSIMPTTSLSFTPVPFLVFSGGFQLGTGWDLGNLLKGGMSVYSPTLENTNNYEALSPFEHLFTRFWFQGTFQFDTGAIFQGDWTHVQMMYSYQVYYEGLTGVADKTPWKWQLTGNKVNGLKEYQQAILAYKMPLMLSRIGIVFESERYYKDSVYINEKYRASLPELNASLMGQLSFTKKDTLTVLLNFCGRKAFAVYDEKLPDSAFTTTGTEWYFKRIALSYSHSF